MTTLLAIWISLVAAVVPTVVYVLVFYWADRYEREPLWLASVAFLWGAIPAIVVSVLGETFLGATFVVEPESFGGSLVDGALIAPVVEEVAKGAALLGIVLLRPWEFDGVLDGLLYGALIGFGFAMTENFFYFVGAYDEGGYVELTFVILLRAVIFGLNHAFYACLTGIGFGLARTARNRLARIAWPLLGLCAAIIAHSLHNLGATMAGFNALGLMLSLSVVGAGIAVFLLVVMLSWRHERNVMRRELADEVGSTLTETEFDRLVGSWRRPLSRHKPSARRQARLMQLYAELAFRKHWLRRAVADHQSLHEQILATQISGIRNQVDELTKAEARTRLRLS